MAQHGVVNGVDVDKLAETIHNVRQQPELAEFHFRATQEWIEGAHARTTIDNFYGAGQDTRHAQSYTLDVDEPAMLLGTDQAPNPTEALLHALASCLGTTFVYHAAARGVTIDGLRVELEGDLDLRGFLGISDDVRRGFQDIRVTFDVDADAPPETIEELCQMAQRYSPVFDSVTNPVSVMVSLAEPEQAAAEKPTEQESEMMADEQESEMMADEPTEPRPQA
jgi:uncharacterized OsmC-like protein